MRGSFKPPGIWFHQPQSNVQAPRPGIILDRDGVLVREMNYLRRPEDVALEPAVAELLHWVKSSDILIAVVTNQSGIDRGIISWDEFLSVEQEISRQLRTKGLSVDLSVACPFHPDCTPAYAEEHSYWRKPGPGMLRFAGETLGLVLDQSWMIGDKASDIVSAKAAGLAGAFFLRGAHYADQESEALSHSTLEFPVSVIDRLDAVICRLQSLMA